MKDIILFSQAAADIQYILHLYEIYKDYKINIIVVNVKNNYKFFKSLALNADISFIPLISQRHLLQFLLFTYKLKSIYFRDFVGITNAKVYFFSNNYDYVTAFFIQKLSHRNNVYFCDLYNIDGKALKGTRTWIKVLITKFLLGIRVKFFKLTSYTAYQYIFEATDVEHITLIVNMKQLKKYLYKYELETTYNRKVLLFESNEQSNGDFVDYEKHLAVILSRLVSSYDIYVKPHPRLGFSPILNNHNIKIIPEYIPSELLNLDDFELVLGMASASIATAIHSNKYSLIYLFEFRDMNRKTYLIDYLNRLSKNNLAYLESLDDLHIGTSS